MSDEADLLVYYQLYLMTSHGSCNSKRSCNVTFLPLPSLGMNTHIRTLQPDIHSSYFSNSIRVREN